METLLARTLAWLTDAGPAQGPHRAAIAVSGGLDSVVLMHVLGRLAPGLGWTLAILHVDHALRPTSAYDAALVAALAERAALPFAGCRTPVRPHRGESLEMAARRVRYACLEDAASRLDCDLIATAHHADDVAETALMRLARGSGAGTLGIPVRNGRLIRPLLHATRAELAEYARQHRLPYLTDASNADRSIPRNRVRHEWLPVMTAAEPGLVRALARTAELARADDAQLEALARQALAAARAGRGLDLAVLARTEAPVLRRLLRLAVRETAGIELEFDHVEALRRVAAGDPAASLPGGVQAVRAGGRLLFVRGPQAPAPLVEAPLEVGETIVAALALRVRLGRSEADDGLGHRPAVAGERRGPQVQAANHWHGVRQLVPAAAVRGRLRLRTLRPGDRLELSGGGHKAVRRIFIDARIPRPARPLWPLLVDEAGVLAVVGLGADRRVWDADPGGAVWKLEFSAL